MADRRGRVCGARRLRCQCAHIEATDAPEKTNGRAAVQRCEVLSCARTGVGVVQRRGDGERLRRLRPGGEGPASCVLRPVSKAECRASMPGSSQ